MSNINLIILTELNKAEKMVAAGKVTGNNVSKVINSGAARKTETHLKGLDKGTDNIYKKYDVKEKNGLLGKIFPVTIPDSYGSATIHVPKSGKGSLIGMITGKTLFHSKDLTPIMRRHEADEIRSVNSISKRKKNREGAGPVLFTHNGKAVGQHASPKVLQREHDYTSYLSKLNKPISNFYNVRVKSGEYGDKILKLSNNQTRKIEDKAAKHTREASRKINSMAQDITHNIRNTSGFFGKLKALKSGISKLMQARGNFNYKYDV